LDVELVRRQLVPSRAAAGRALAEGLVEVDGVPAPKPATMVTATSAIRLAARPDRFVSRGGQKLDHALARFGIEVVGKRAIDVGASTGGFTDCLLQRGCAEVVAVDVGYGQLAWTLQRDDRVRVVDRTNIRYADPGDLGAPFALVAVDVSFIGVAKLAAVLSHLGGPGTDFVVLVKPQFELEKEAVGKGGIVREAVHHLTALRRVVTAMADAGLGAWGVTPSPITGAKGNREFLVWFREEQARIGESEMREAVAS
jgi:23S rRNA (cytidine1920-2'-O)/16S rRNA (cytidine1409-2'-O)-methyltransferase